MLESHHRRLRGEIFFAERWLIVEGQSDYLLVHAIARAMNYELDKYGVSVIDAGNNQDPAILATLARALALPWLAVFDGDAGGEPIIQNIKKRGFSNEEMNDRCRLHPNGNLEDQLVADQLGEELREILDEIGISKVSELNDAELVKKLRRCKSIYTAKLAERIHTTPKLATRMPIAFRDSITQLRGLA